MASNYTAQSREAGRAPLPIDSLRSEGTKWWVQPLLTVAVLTLFGIYTTIRALQNSNFIWSPVAAINPPDWHTHDMYGFVERATYLSPFFSPYIPIFLSIGTFAISPAFYILIFPLSFRLTCYYYRKAYYRAFLWDPPACSLAEPRADARMRYTGEREFPFIAQNFHRFAFYAAAIFILILGWDAIKSFMAFDAEGHRHLYVGLGSLIFVLNVVLLGMYTFGCHSCRHLVGGGVNCFSESGATKARFGIWQKISWLNKRHSLFAWCSMISVAVADIYVNLVSRGVFPDPHIMF